MIFKFKNVIYYKILNPIKKEHIEEASSIVSKLRSLTNINFNCSANNYFEDYYKPGFEIFYKTRETAFKKTKSSP